LKVYKFLKEKKFNKDISVNIHISKNIIGNVSHFIDLIRYLFNSKLTKIKYDKKDLRNGKIANLKKIHLLYDRNIKINIYRKTIKENSLELFLFVKEKLKFRVFEKIFNNEIYLLNHNKVILKENFHLIKNSNFNYFKKKKFSLIDKDYIALTELFLKSINLKNRKFVE
jgi:hypothetical protein